MFGIGGDGRSHLAVMCFFFYLGVEGGWLFFGFLFLSSLLLPGNGSDEEDPSAHQEDG